MRELSAVIFFGTLSLLYLTGAIRMLFSFKRSGDSSTLLRPVLILIFLFPFSLYLSAGLMNITFGWARNFFYLLPIYLLVIFYCLKTVLKNKRRYYLISGIILTLLLCSGIAESLLWETANLKREKIRYATKADNVLIIVSRDRDRAWPLEYYAKRYGVCDKVLYLHESAINKKDFSILNKLSSPGIFMVLEDLKGSFSIKKGRYYLGKDSFEIIKVKLHRAGVGPYQLLKDLLKLPSPHIAIYYCKR